MTEGKLMAMFSDMVGSSMDSDYRSGLLAGYHGLASPCRLNVRCAEGIIAGRDLRKLFLSLDGKTDDHQVNASIVRILSPDDIECVPSAVLKNADWARGRRAPWIDPFVLAEAFGAN